MASISAALAVLLTIFAGLGTGTADAAKPKCTIKGTKGPDRLVGTGKRDTICGIGGRDVLIGKGGNDRMIGGAGDDRFRGDAGADTLDGGAGKDDIRGGNGDDRLIGGPGKDRLLGQPQDDTLLGGPGDDYLNGGGGSNVINGGGGQNRCLAGAADTLAGTCDNTGPQVIELTLAPGSVDSWDQSRTIEVRYRLTDERSGLRLNAQHLGARHAATGQMIYSMPSRVSGDQTDAVFEATIHVPRYSAQGRWDLDIQASDEAGNYARTGPAELEALGLPSGFDQTGRGDSVKPQISDLTIDRTSVDSSGSDQIINAQVHVTDDLTGINMETTNGVGMVAYHRGQEQFNYGDCTRSSGTALDGMYDCTIVIRRYSAPGEWELRIGARDHAGNETLLSYIDLRNLGYPWAIRQTGPGDTEAPKLVELSVTPSHIDTTYGPATVGFRMRITDNLSGVPEHAFGASLDVNGVQSSLQVDMYKTSGGPLDSVYEGSIIMPQGSTNGSWSPNIPLSDFANNSEFLYPVDLTALGFTTGFTNGP